MNDDIEKPDDDYSLFDILDGGALIDISPDFYRFDDKKPFEQCTICGKELIESNSNYVIEKAIKKYPMGAHDVIFEYACCEDCIKEMSDKMSKNSRKKMTEFSSAKSPNFYNHVYQNAETRKNTCFFSGVEIKENESYQFYGIFRGNKMDKLLSPVAYSEKIVEEVQELLSPETLEELDDFMKKIFPKIPEFEEEWKFKPIIF